MNARGSSARHRACLAFGFCLLAHGVMAAAGGAPNIGEQTLRYAASYKNLRAGEIEIRIRHADDGYAVASTAKPSKLASLFLQSHHSDTRFIRRHGRVALQNGREILLGDNGYRRDFQIDYARGRIAFGDGRYADMEADAELEAAAFPLLLMLRPLDAVGGARVLEVSGKRARAYRYETPTPTRVKVPAGEFASWKIVRRRVDRPRDSVTVWLQKTANPIPLKIMAVKKNRVSVLALLAPPEPNAQ